MSRPTPFEWLVLAFCVAVWGSAYAALKFGSQGLSPLWLTTGRLAVAAAFLGVLTKARGQPLPPLRDPAWRYYAACGLLGMAAPFSLYAFSAARLPSAVNAICNGSTPIFTALLAHALLPGEPLSRRRGAGVALGFVGVVALAASHWSGAFDLEAQALAAALAGAALYAVTNIITKRAPAVPPAVGALMMTLCGLAFSLLGAVAAEPRPPWPPLPALGAVLWLGIMSNGVAMVAYVFLIQRRGPVFMTMAIYLAPIWAMGLGVAMLGERPEWTALAALALILAGVVLVTFTPRARAPG